MGDRGATGTTTRPATATGETKAELDGGTIRVSRVLKAPRERVYRAYLDPDAMSKWLPPNGFTGHVHEQDARVGGRFRMSFSTLDRKWTQYFGGEYLELVPFERIVHTDVFESDDPAMQGEMRVTVTFTEVPGGTEMNVVQENAPAVAAEGAPEGWTQSMENLARLVEAELPF